MPETQVVQLKGAADYFITSDGKLFRNVDHYPVEISPNYTAEYPFWMVEMDGNWRRCYCHREMAIHFIPNPNNLPVVAHRDDNKNNWQISNLMWSNQSDNVKSAYQHDLSSSGTPFAVVQRIKSFLQQGFPMKDIAAWTGVGYQTIYDIKAGRRHA